jgi:hypothetical protein
VRKCKPYPECKCSCRRAEEEEEKGEEKGDEEADDNTRKAQCLLWTTPLPCGDCCRGARATCVEHVC